MQTQTSTRQRTGTDSPHLPGSLMRADGGEPPRVQMSPPRLAGATLTWLAGVFAICYLAVPALTASVGITAPVLSGLWFNLPAFAAATLVSVVGIALVNPSVATDVGGRRDPVLSSMVGGFLAWAVLHSVAPGLQSLFAMEASHLFAFGIANLLECALIGMMLASFTRSKVLAFLLSGLWQLMVLGVAVTLLGLAAF